MVLVGELEAESLDTLNYAVMGIGAEGFGTEGFDFIPVYLLVHSLVLGRLLYTEDTFGFH